MSFKTILMHCNDRRRIGKLLAPTVRLAEGFQAHLVGLSVVPPAAFVGAGMPGTPAMIVDAHCQLYRDESPAMRAAFESAARGRGFVADCVLPYAHNADLLVMGCYGHTRFRELVFGGASRYLLAHMPVPMLMSH